MTSDLDEQLGYDADHDDPRQYCEHGTFIGSWWGPDYLCHWCEMGYSRAEFDAEMRQRAEAAIMRGPLGGYLRAHEVIGDLYATGTFSWGQALRLVGALVDPPDHVIHAYEQLQEIAA